MTARRAVGAAVLVAILGALAAGALVGDGARAALADSGPACLFRALTGIVCPFCGMTRATLALGAGDVGAALAHHPLSPLVLVAVVWCALRLTRARPVVPAGRRIAASALLAAVALVWLVNLTAHA